MVVCVAIATGLGFWQLDAWQTRRADAARDLSAADPVALSSVMTPDGAFPGRSLGRPVEFHGTWTGDNIYIADRALGDENGYWVVTAAEVAGTGSAMPVVRGWSATPDTAAISGATDLVGWLQATEASGPLDPDPRDDVIPTMRVASLVEKVDLDLYSGYVIADAARTPDLDPPGAVALAPVTPAEVPPVSGFTALRNLFYAIEWWVFAAFALFIWGRWCRDTLNPPERTGATEPDPTPVP